MVASRLLTPLREFIEGLFLQSMTVSVLRTRQSLDNLFMAVLVGDMLGVPITAPYYRLTILPYLVPNLSKWKVSALVERDLF